METGVGSAEFFTGQVRFMSTAGLPNHVITEACAHNVPFPAKITLLQTHIKLEC